jgi:hypothetical protein
MKYKFITLLLLITLSLSTLTISLPRRPYSADIADIDLDNDLDIVVGHKTLVGYNNPTISIILNNSEGYFSLHDTSLVFAGTREIYIREMDNNNLPDLVAYSLEIDGTIIDRSIRIFYDYTDMFYYYQAYSLNDINNITGVDIGDINSDNNLDVIIYSNQYFFWGILYNNSIGELSDPIYYNLEYPPQDISIGDINGDQRDDVLVAGTNRLDAWLNFEDGLEYYCITDTSLAGQSVICDIDNDSDNDIITIFWGMPGSSKILLIYSNDGYCNFEITYTQIIEQAAAEITSSDLNNDEYQDIIFNCYSAYPNSPEEPGNTYILFNNQDNTFQDPVNYYTGQSSNKTYSHDLDHNGWKDLITTNYSFESGAINILYNDGTGNFVEDPQVGINEECIVYNKKGKLSNYPNPFKPSIAGRTTGTTISYELPVNIENASIEIFNIKGERIRELKIENLKCKINSVVWDGKDYYRNPVSSGVYLYRLKSDEGVLISKRMLLLK